jgi:uncharacterized damage-inducible protein DinB
MLDSDTACVLARYNDWADRTLFSVLEHVPTHEIVGPSNTLFGSILATLNHNYQVDLIWHAHLTGRKHGFSSRRDLLCATLPALVAAQCNANEWLIDWVDGQDAANLAETVSFEFVSGRAAQMARGAMLLHLYNHKTYHRGWVCQMLFELGVTPPETDLPVYLSR